MCPTMGIHFRVGLRRSCGIPTFGLSVSLGSILVQLHKLSVKGEVTHDHLTVYESQAYLNIVSRTLASFMP